MTVRVKVSKLQTARIRKGLSIRALSKAAGLSSATIFKLENDDTEPSPSTVKKICEALNVEFDEIFEIVDSEKGA